MVKQPFTFLASFLLFFLGVGSVFLKIVEQGSQEVFNDFLNCFYFSIVTVCTLGYGDMYPVTTLGRLLTVVLLLVGISLVSTLSSITVSKIVNAQGTEEKRKEMKQKFHERWLKLQEGLMYISSPYNPLMSVFDSFEEDKIHDVKNEKMKQASQKHLSSILNVTVPMKSIFSEGEAAHQEKASGGGGGKFTVNNIGKKKKFLERKLKIIFIIISSFLNVFYLILLGSQAEIIRQLAKLHEESALVDIIESSKNKEMSAIRKDTRLQFILKKFKIDQKDQGVPNFNEMLDELQDILFETHRFV